MSSSFSETTRSLVDGDLVTSVGWYLALLSTCNEGIHWVETKVAKTHNSQILYSMKR